jgi:hypothetical protein
VAEVTAQGAYARDAREYRKLGWPNPIPVRGKTPPVAGYTGYDGADVTDQDMTRWCTNPNGYTNIALRLHDGVIGIDVDHYDGKTGGDTIAKAEAELGPLPPTWKTTSRGPGQPAGILLFKVPLGLDWSGAQANLGDAYGGNVDVIHRGHRYAMVAGSNHPTLKLDYRWYDPDGVVSGKAPAPDDLADLLEAWVAHLTKPRRRTPKTAEPGLEQPEADEPIPRGQRRDTLKRYAGKLRQRGLTLAEGKVLFHHRWEQCEQPPDDPAPWETYEHLLEDVFDRYTAGPWHEEPPPVQEPPSWDQGYQPPDDPPPVEDPADQLPPDLFRLWTPAELLAADRTFTWRVRGMLAHPTYGPIGGERKSLKTYIATFIALGTAAGASIFDHFEVAQTARVIAYVGEGGRIPYTRRLERVADAMGITLADLDLLTSFDVAPIGSDRFRESLHRDLDQGPGLVVLDPLYAFHPPATSASNLYERGSMLASVSGPCVEAGASLLVPDHWNKTGSGRGLDRISQVGVQEWADTWLLLSHREDPDVEAGLFRLTLEIGSRQWGGSSWNLDLDIGRFDPDLGSHDGTITWDLRRAAGKPSRDTKTEDAILALLNDQPFELTESAVIREIGGRKDRTRDAFKQLLSQRRISVRTVPRQEGNRTVRRDLVGIAGQQDPPDVGAVGTVATTDTHSVSSEPQSNHAPTLGVVAPEAPGEQQGNPSPSYGTGSVARLPAPGTVSDGSGRAFTVDQWRAAGRPGLELATPMRCDRCGFTTADPRVASYSHSGCGGQFQPAEVAP